MSNEPRHDCSSIGGAHDADCQLAIARNSVLPQPGDYPTARRRKRVVCADCSEIYGEQYATDDGCPRYDEAENAQGVLYCRNCGHGEWVHP